MIQDGLARWKYRHWRLCCYNRKGVTRLAPRRPGAAGTVIVALCRAAKDR